MDFFSVFSPFIIIILISGFFTKSSAISLPEKVMLFGDPGAVVAVSHPSDLLSHLHFRGGLDPKWDAAFSGDFIFQPTNMSWAENTAKTSTLCRPITPTDLEEKPILAAFSARIPQIFFETAKAGEGIEFLYEIEGERGLSFLQLVVRVEPNNRSYKFSMMVGGRLVCTQEKLLRRLPLDVLTSQVVHVQLYFTGQRIGKMGSLLMNDHRVMLRETDGLEWPPNNGSNYKVTGLRFSVVQPTSYVVQLYSLLLIVGDSVQSLLDSKKEAPKKTKNWGKGGSWVVVPEQFKKYGDSHTLLGGGITLPTGSGGKIEGRGMYGNGLGNESLGGGEVMIDIDEKSKGKLGISRSHNGGEMVEIEMDQPGEVQVLVQPEDPYEIRNYAAKPECIRTGLPCPRHFACCSETCRGGLCCMPSGSPCLQHYKCCSLSCKRGICK